jgi:hypothetical protein
MSITSKRFFTRHPAGQAVLLGLILWVSYATLPAAVDSAEPHKAIQSSSSFSVRLSPQAITYPPAGLSYRPIPFGIPVSGTLTSTDQLLLDGRPVDGYFVTTRQPNESYIVTISSPDTRIASQIGHLQSRGYIQYADRGAPGAVQYSGVLGRPGRYSIDVTSVGVRPPVGHYGVLVTH